MKILKDKTYEALLSDSKEKKVYQQIASTLQNTLDSKTAQIIQQIEFEKASILDDRKKTIIVGWRGNGKTSLLKHILKSMSNYYLVDLLGEYDKVDHKNKFTLKNHLASNLPFLSDNQFDKMISILSKKIEEQKTIVIDNSELFFMNHEQANSLAYMLCQREISFIVVSQNIDKLPRLIKDMMKQVVVCNGSTYCGTSPVESSKITPFLTGVSIVNFSSEEISKII